MMSYCGAKVMIIGGIRIGNNVTIGAGSVVVKDIPDDCVAVGNPARVIKQVKSWYDVFIDCSGKDCN